MVTADEQAGIALNILILAQTDKGRLAFEKRSRLATLEPQPNKRTRISKNLKVHATSSIQKRGPKVFTQQLGKCIQVSQCVQKCKLCVDFENLFADADDDLTPTEAIVTLMFQKLSRQPQS
jgi:hypothetical protein